FDIYTDSSDNAYLQAGLGMGKTISIGDSSSTRYLFLSAGGARIYPGIGGLSINTGTNPVTALDVRTTNSTDIADFQNAAGASILRVGL
ncbi:hypothetical protein ACSLVQ_28695, partial [Klebsiella pneumoniae]|uniref:hypothetical protein n=1 Tax=Klebsiella pneumoniae TaxID=573 RepID=UPI003EE3F8C0